MGQCIPGHNCHNGRELYSDEHARPTSVGLCLKAGQQWLVEWSHFGIKRGFCRWAGSQVADLLGQQRWPSRKKVRATPQVWSVCDESLCTAVGVVFVLCFWQIWQGMDGHLSHFKFSYSQYTFSQVQPLNNIYDFVDVGTFNNNDECYFRHVCFSLHWKCNGQWPQKLRCPEIRATFILNHTTA